VPIYNLPMAFPLFAKGFCRMSDFSDLSPNR
jgi:hypothetical protein